jgi:hypothetical protein
MNSNINVSNWLRVRLVASVAVAGFGLSFNSLAHISYSGRDFGSFSGLADSSVSINNQAVTGNFGWADAADGNLGDSHKGRAFRFHLDNAALVTIRVAANPNATATSVGGLLPGFSVYQGLAATSPFAATQTALPSSPDHDFADASVAWRTAFAQFNLGSQLDSSATGGSWNALGNWKIGGDGDLPGDFSQLSTFNYRGFGVDYDHDGVATLTQQFGAGDYTLFIGGNDLATKDSATATSAFGLSATVSVQATPEPTTWALLGMGGALLAVSCRPRR